MEKSPEAFRTISEVADWLGVPTHVLRFWESRFSQIKPVKRAGGRRYYRPSDMALIGGIKRLLHDDGMTIRGAQKLLREKGAKHVASLSQPLDGVPMEDDEEVIEAVALPVPPAPRPEAADDVSGPDPQEPAAEPEPEPEPDLPEPEPEPVAEAPEPVAPEPVAPEPVVIVAPDVPETDPEDDDTSHPGTPGLAARLRLADPAGLAAHRAALAALAPRLGA